MDLVHAFFNAWESADGSPRLIDETETLSLPEMASRAFQLSRLIKSHAPKSAGFIPLLIPNTASFAIGFWGTLLAGKVAMPLNFMLRPAEILPLLKIAESPLVLSHFIFKPLMDAVKAEAKLDLKVLYLDQHDWEKTEKKTPPHEVDLSLESRDPDRPAVLLFTAGTSAFPKGVLLSHKNLLSNLEGCQKVLKTGKEDTFLGILPFFHSFGKTTSLLLPMLKESRVVFISNIQPRAIAEAIQKYNVTALIMVPSLYGLLLKFPDLKNVDFSSIRMAVSGGGPLSPLLEQAFPAITGTKIYNGYGLTEASPVVSVNSIDQYKKGSIGRPLFNTSVTVRSSDGAPLSPGKIGEFYVKGDNVMLRYLGLEKETNSALTPEGELCTGDLGYMDEEGFLFITGRKKELIICSGENVHPLEVETALAMHPAVEEAAVIGAPDSLRGEHPKAFVRLRQGQNASAPELRRICREKLAPFKIPREFVFVEDFPRNALGKILKRKLREIS